MVLDSTDELSDDDDEEAADVESTECVQIDERFMWFPEYRKDIYQYLRQAEVPTYHISNCKVSRCC